MGPSNSSGDKTEFFAEWLDKLKDIGGCFCVLVWIGIPAVCLLSLNIDLDLYYVHAHSCHQS